MTGTDVDRAQTEATAVAAALYAALAAFDVPTFAALLAPDIEWTEPSAPGFRIGGTYRGVDAVLAALGPIPSEWDRFAFVVDEIVPLGDRALGLGYYDLRAKATGVAVTAPFAHVFTVVDGRVTRLHVYSDRGNLVRALDGSG